LQDTRTAIELNVWKYPRTVTRSCAAKLAGVSRELFNSTYIETGLVALDPEDGRVLLWSLAAALHRPIELTDIFAANEALEPSRFRQRQRDRQKKAA
jgi:hypothetical protein